MQVESWVDEDGRVLRASSALGFTMERTEYELVRQEQEDAVALPLKAGIRKIRALQL